MPPAAPTAHEYSSQLPPACPGHYPQGASFSGSNHHIEPDKPGVGTARGQRERTEQIKNLLCLRHTLTLDRFGNFNQTLSSGQATGPMSFTMG